MGAPAEPPPHTLAHHALRRPRHPAVVEEGRRFDYRILNSRANRLGNGLRSLGLRQGDRVALMLPNRAEFLEATFACRKAGFGGVPVGTRLRAREVRHILEDSDARALLFDGAFAGVAREARAGLAALEHSVIVGEGAADGEVDYEDLLARASDAEPFEGREVQVPSMFYTSGTTGAPKGAYRDPKQSDVAGMALMAREFGFGPGDIHLVAGPLYHSAPNRFSLLHLVLGATVVLMKEFDAEGFLRAVEEHRATTAFVVPTMLARMNDLPGPAKRGHDLSSMRALVVAGAPCPLPVKEGAVRLFGPVLYEFYGSTETGMNALLRPEDQLRKPGSCGKVFPGNEIRILDERGRPVPPGQPGLLYIKNAGLVTRYHKQPEATARNFRDGFFTVGDVARMDDEGYLYIVDRDIDMVISGGVNIYPAEIEAVLRSHPAVADAAVVGVPDGEWGESLKAFVVRRAGAALTAEEVVEFSKRNLASFKKPKSVEFVVELPYGPSGKVLKRELRERAGGGEMA